MMHPNVVTVFDLGYHTDGSPYIVMELLKGRDLLQLLREEPGLDLRRKVTIVAQVLDGLGARPQGRHRAPRHQARQRLHRRRAATRRSWTSASPTSARRAGRDGHDPRHGELHVAGAGDGRAPGRPQRPLQRGMHAGGAGRRQSPFEAESAMNTLYRIAHERAELVAAPGRGRRPAGGPPAPCPGERPRRADSQRAEFAAELRSCWRGRISGRASPAEVSVVTRRRLAPTRQIATPDFASSRPRRPLRRARPARRRSSACCARSTSAAGPAISTSTQRPGATAAARPEGTDPRRQQRRRGRAPRRRARALRAARPGAPRARGGRGRARERKKLGGVLGRDGPARPRRASRTRSASTSARSCS